MALHHMKKRAALTKYTPLYEQGLMAEELHAEMAKDGYSEDDTKEIMAALISQESGAGPNTQGPAKEEPNADPKEEPKVDDPAKNDPAASSATPSANVAPAGTSPYRKFDLWRVEASREERTDPATRQRYTVITAYEAIKKIRENVKLEPNVARDINAQSHNSGQRYYPAGTVTNGDTEKINLTTY